jgi:non-specific serine/threonine protein kinase
MLRTRIDTLDTFSLPRRTPRSYQQRVIDLAVRRNVLVEHECGLGKTVTAIEAVKAFRERGEFKGLASTLVVCKKGNRDQWFDSIAAQEPTARVEIWESVDDADVIPPQKSVWIITHYELLLKLWPVLASRLWGCVICDEAHRISNRNTKRSQALKKIQAVRKIALTATPVEHDPADYWSICNWLYPEQFTSFWAFRNKFADIERSYLGYEKVVGIRNKEALNALLRPFVDRATKSEVAPELPVLIQQVIPIDLSKVERAAYKTVKAAKDILVNLDPGGVEIMLPNTLTRMIRLQQIASDLQLLLGVNVGAQSSKIAWVLDYIADAPTEKIVIMTKFRDTCIKLAHILNAAVVVGSPSEMERSLPSLDTFKNGKCNVLVGTLAALSEGYDLPQARTAIFVDVDWSSTRMTQARDRIHRLGSPIPKNIIYLLARNTVDELIYQAVQQKWTEKELLDKLDS